MNIGALIEDCEVVAKSHAEQMEIELTEYDGPESRSAHLSASINGILKRIIAQPATTWPEIRAKAKIYLLIDLHELGASLARDVIELY